MVFYETFGEGGTAQAFFGGQWWLVGFFLVLIFLVFAIAYRLPSDSLIMILLIGLLSASSYALFFIYAEQMIQTIIVIILIYISIQAYNFIFSR